METIDEKMLKIRIPSGMIISGPSNSGKTRFVLRLLKQTDELFDPPPKAIVYCYGAYHSYIPELERSGVIVCSGVPTDELIRAQPRPFLLILDDLMYQINEKSLSEIFTKRAHHEGFSVIFITQSLFEKSLKVARNNAQYIVLMRAPNAALQIRNLGSQLFPRQLPFFLDAYRQATNKPYAYIFLDLHPASHSASLKVRTNIFPDDKERTLFIPRNA